MMTNYHSKIKSQICVIGIDPGVTGSFTMITPHEVEVEKMPKKENPEEILQILMRFRKHCESIYGVRPFVIIERVMGRAESWNSAFSVGVLLENYGRCHQSVIGCGMRIFELLPMQWKSSLKVTVKAKKNPLGQKIPLTVKERKTPTNNLVKRMYPGLRCTLDCYDSVAIAILAKGLIEGEYNLAIKTMKQFNKKILK